MNLRETPDGFFCEDCGNETWRNPPTIATAIVRVYTAEGIGILAIRRSDGGIAFPAGYQRMGETIAEAAARELLEETYLDLRHRADSSSSIHEQSTPDKTLNLHFKLFPDILEEADLPEFVPNQEAVERMVVTEECIMKFPIHQELLHRLLHLDLLPRRGGLVLAAAAN